MAEEEGQEHISTRQIAQEKQVQKLVAAAKEVAGTPGGKSKKSRAQFWLSLKSMRQNPLTRKLELLSEEDLATIAMIQKAKKGNVIAYQALMDRAYGKPKQETEHNINKTLTIAAFTWGTLPEGKTLELDEEEIQLGEEAQFDSEEEDAEDIDLTEFER